MRIDADVIEKNSNVGSKVIRIDFLLNAPAAHYAKRAGRFGDVRRENGRLIGTLEIFCERAADGPNSGYIGHRSAAYLSTATAVLSRTEPEFGCTVTIISRLL